jgi:preprotein translocase subunit SecG
MKKRYGKARVGGITMLLVVHLVVVVIFVILGIVFLNGKGSFLIAGYNTASKAKKEKIDEKKLCNYTGKLMFVLAGCFLIIAASDIFCKMWLLWTGLVLFLAAAIGGIVFMNTGNRLKR